MKRILSLPLLLLVVVSSAVCQEAEADAGAPPLPIFSRRYRGDGFSVLLPSRPAITMSKVTRKDGQERTKRLVTVTMNGVFTVLKSLRTLNPRNRWKSL